MVDTDGFSRFWKVRLQGLQGSIESRIYKANDEHTDASFSLVELCARATTLEAGEAASFLARISSQRLMQQADLLYISQSLIVRLSNTSLPYREDIEESLLAFTTANSDSLAGLNIMIQIVRLWTDSFIESDSQRLSYVQLICSRLQKLPESIGTDPNTPPSLGMNILSRALDSIILRKVTAESIEAILQNDAPTIRSAKKELASRVLQVLRHSQDHAALRRLASLAFTSQLAGNSAAQSHVELKEPSARLEANEKNAEVSRAKLIVEKLSGQDGSAQATRLTAQDFNALRRLEGLSLESFKCVTERIRTRALVEPWARAAILHLARAPHAPEVTPSVRTAVLGSLVSEARRLGRLTPQIEKEIFAASAELPILPSSES